MTFVEELHALSRVLVYGTRQHETLNRFADRIAFLLRQPFTHENMRDLVATWTRARIFYESIIVEDGDPSGAKAKLPVDMDRAVV